MTYPCCRFYIRIFALLLATVLAVLVARAGFTNNKFSEVEAAPPRKTTSPPRRLRLSQVTPATPPASTPPPAPSAAKATATANTAKIDAPPVEVAKAPTLEVVAPKARYLAGEDPEHAKRSAGRWHTRRRCRVPSCRRSVLSPTTVTRFPGEWGRWVNGRRTKCCGGCRVK